MKGPSEESAARFFGKSLIYTLLAVALMVVLTNAGVPATAIILGFLVVGALGLIAAANIYRRNSARGGEASRTDGQGRD